MDTERQSILTTEQKKEIVTLAKEQFAFLKRDKGLSKPLICRLSDGLIIYRNATLGIRLKLDFSSRDDHYDSLEVALGKLDSAGQFPIFPYVGDGSRRYFWILQSFLVRQLHVQDEPLLNLEQWLQRFPKKGNIWNVEQWKHAIGLYQALVETYIDQILNQPVDELFPTAIEYLSVKHEVLAQLINKHFAFLQEYDFQPDPIKESYGTTFTWINAEYGIRILWDYQFNDYAFSIIKLINGKIPTYTKRDLKRDEFTEGSRLEVSLFNLFSKRLSATDEEMNTIQHIATLHSDYDYSDRDYTYVDTLFSLYAILLRRYITQILSGSF